MDASEWTRVDCPYCGESIELQVDVGAGAYRTVEDCAVCCRPIEVAVDVGVDGAETVTVARGDE